MVNVTVCVGSSCHLKGSRQVVESLQELIQKSGKADNINLNGAFCMGQCSTEGVSMKVDGEYFSVKPEDIEEFFKNNILTKA